ncbi:hypothetical protein N7510_000937 [Penicillium lagena]|nr:hypothetical protein N7510_000937 [Penicillium lagena]
MRPQGVENRASRPLSLSSWVGDHQRILTVACTFFFFFFRQKIIYVRMSPWHPRKFKMATRVSLGEKG